MIFSGFINCGYHYLAYMKEISVVVLPMRHLTATLPSRACALLLSIASALLSRPCTLIWTLLPITPHYLMCVFI